MPKELARPLKVGLLLPIAEETMAGATLRWNDLKAIARLAEAGGFDSLWVADHLIMDFTAYGIPAETRAGWWDCWSILAALAAVTTEVELGTIVACVGFRNPALLAKMADTIDEISGGRLILGLGAGYHEPEHRAFGYPFDHLVGRFEEALQIIHPLLRKGAVDFHGKYHQATECELRPRASRSAGPPILIGTSRPDRPRMLRLCAQYADYWNIVWANQMADLLPALQAIDAACAKTGRDPATLRRSVAMAVVLPAAEQQRTTENWARYLFRRPPATGTVEQLADHLRTYAQKGIDHVQLWIEPFTMSGIEAFLPVLEILDRG